MCVIPKNPCQIDTLPVIRNEIIAGKIAVMEKTLTLVSILAVVFFGIFRLRYGIPEGDEGLLLSAGYRILLGDIPFRDELNVTFAWSFVWMVPLFNILPEMGQLFLARSLGFLVHAFSLGALLFSLRRFLPPTLLVAAWATTVLINPNDFWIFVYYIVSSDLLALASALWIEGFHLENKLLRRTTSLAAGLLLAGSSLAYITIPAVVLTVMASIFLYERKHKLGAGSYTLWTLVGFGVGILAAGLWLSNHDLFFDWFNGLYRVKTESIQGENPLRRIAACGYHFFGFTVYLIPIHYCVSMILGRMLERKISRPTAFASFLVYTIGMSIFLSYKGPTGYYFRFAYFLTAWMVLFTAFSVRSLYLHFSKTENWRGAVCALFLAVLSCSNFALICISSTNRFLSTGNIVPFMLYAFLILAYGSGPDPSGLIPFGLKLKKGFLMGFCLFIALPQYVAKLSFLPVQDTYRSSLPKLAGTLSNRETMESIDQTVYFLRKQDDRGKYLLTYIGCAVLNYLTDMPQAIQASDATYFFFPVAWRLSMLDTMVQRGRSPLFAVQNSSPKVIAYSTDPQVDPVHAFVSKNYTPARTYGNFVIWKRK